MHLFDELLIEFKRCVSCISRLNRVKHIESCQKLYEKLISAIEDTYPRLDDRLQQEKETTRVGRAAQAIGVKTESRLVHFSGLLTSQSDFKIATTFQFNTDRYKTVINEYLEDSNVVELMRVLIDGFVTSIIADHPDGGGDL